MAVMKAFWKAAAPAVVLALCACTSTRAGKVAPASEPAQVAAPATTAEAETAAAAEQAATAPQTKSSTLIGRFFSGLFGFGSKDKQADSPADAAPQATNGEQVTPTPEQQEAALKLLAEQGPGDNIPEPSAQDISVQAGQIGPLTLGLPQFGAEPADGLGTTTLGDGSVLRAAPGLRIRNLAPPEEAISTDGAPNAPKPNSAEMRGLRPIPLPENLPMDINGKLTKDKR